MPPSTHTFSATFTPAYRLLDELRDRLGPLINPIVGSAK